MMKIQLISLFMLLITATAFAQTTHEVSLTGNFVLVPHNQQTGSGYSVGYNHKLNQRHWLNSEFSYSQAMSIKGDTVMVGNFTTLPLTYLLSGFYLSVSPNVKLKLADWLHLGIGIGPSVCYQSSIYDQYHYIIPDGYFDEEEITGVVVKTGYRFGGTANLQIGLNFTQNWALLVNGNYKTYFNGESLLTGGVGLTYMF